jgi:hypothetical protein
MQSITTDSGHRIVLESTDHIRFNAGNVENAYEQIHASATGRSTSFRDLRGYVLKGLLRQVGDFGVEDAQELRVLLDVSVDDDASVDETIAAIFEESIRIIARWKRAQNDQQGASA